MVCKKNLTDTVSITLSDNKSAQLSRLFTAGKQSMKTHGAMPADSPENVSEKWLCCVAVGSTSEVEDHVICQLRPLTFRDLGHAHDHVPGLTQSKTAQSYNNCVNY